MISYYTFQSGTSGGGARGEGVGSGDLDVVESLPPIREGGALGEGVVGAVCVHFTYVKVHVPLYTQTMHILSNTRTCVHIVVRAYPLYTYMHKRARTQNTHILSLFSLAPSVYLSPSRSVCLSAPPPISPTSRTHARARERAHTY